MRRTWRLMTAAVFLTLLAASPAPAAQKVRPPEFQSDYQLPTTEAPNPRPSAYDYVDVAALVAALVLASWLALKRRSRAGLFALMVFCLAYFGFWRGGCICAIGSVQNVSMALFDSAYAVPLAVLSFFLVPLVFALFTGRTFCAAVCPLGAVQDVVAVRPVKVPMWLEHALGLLAYVYLGAAVLLAAMGSAFLICRYDPFISLFRLVPLGKWVQAGGPGAPGGVFGISGRADLLILLGAFLAIGLFVARPYCRYLCPLGAIFRLLSPLSWRHVTITPRECVQCRLCEDSCPYNAILPATPEGRIDRAKEKRRLALLIGLLPVLIAAGAGLGRLASAGLARMDYTVRLSGRVAQEEAGAVQGTTDASDAFRASRRLKQDLYDEAAAIGAKYALAGSLLGGFVGLVVVGKLIRLSVRRRRGDYEPDRAACFACGRCFASCPIEQQRRQERKTAAAFVPSSGRGETRRAQRRR